MRETEKIWQPEPISEEKISGWLDGRNTSPCTCFHPYSSPRSLSCWYTVTESISRRQIKKVCRWDDETHDPPKLKNKTLKLNQKKNAILHSEKKMISITDVPYHPFPPLCYIWRNPFLVFSSESWTPDPPRKLPSWMSWRWRTSESKKNSTNHRLDKR